ncbi:proto-oncogene tyrosine-protein kinase ROS [Mixophyes fleayi]|uniref:proto-oncogene tyrosine-protein kinase ROS n=1 Tax=Mixophyes fleayi TaxID=3061075 RepID=UPI003F4DBADC
MLTRLGLVSHYDGNSFLLVSDLHRYMIIPCDVHCVYVNDSYSGIQDYIEDCTIEPTPPFVSSIGYHNVTLRWNASNISEATYMVQIKYVNIPGVWENAQAVTEPLCTVNNLQPYTEYLFRIIWIICQLQFYSAPSPVYRTLAFGVPAVSPVIESLYSPTSETIEASWLPPPFPNGPIIGYNLKLYTDGESQKHISVVGRQNFQFYATKPATTYSFSITAANKHGESPAAEANITTLGSAVPDKSPWLFLSNNGTLKQRTNLKDVVHESQCLTTHSKIHSVSLNVYTQAVYFSAETHIWVKGASNITDMSDLNIFHTDHGTITSLCIDWLHHKMYFIMNNQVYVCDLLNCTATVNIPLQDDFKPKKILVDPYNGYLFFLLDDGIHRMILPEPSIHSNVTEHIVMKTVIQDFIVSSQSRRIVYARSSRPGFFEIVSVFMDGSNDQLLRQINDESIKEIRSFLYFSDSLMFTDGNVVLYEDFFMNQYWYNEYLVTCDLAVPPSSDYNNIILYAESTQPIPLPSSPEHVMAVFGTESATIIWKPPKLNIGASPASWQKWMYSVSISSAQYGIQQLFSNISSTEITVTRLNLTTTYEITVQSSSPAGVSQWTDPVRGTTQHPAEEEPYLLAVGSKGLWRQPLDKFGHGKLVYDKLRSVSDLDWYNGTLYWSNETGHVHMWNIQDTAEFSALNIPEIRRAGPLSFDWIGHYIYWSDKVNAKIYRTSLRKFTRDTVTLVRYLVTDLVVDSLNAFLYWTTAYTIESSRLNGQDHLIIQNLTLFSSTQVVALTLDLKDGRLYWLVKNGFLINLYNANIRKHGLFDIKVTEFAHWSSSEISQHALMFHSDRLFWINGQKYITVQEVNQSSGTPFSQPAEFTTFTLVLNPLKPLPGNFSYTPEVIPDMIPSSSFEISGSYSHFLILWKEPSNIEYGTLFYCVESTVLHELLGTNCDCLTPEVLTDSYYTIEGLEPYTEFDFAVTPYTYYAKGPTTSLTLRAPEGVPSSPLNLRTFILHNSSMFYINNIGVEMRWDNPKLTNGALINFTVNYRVVNESEYNETVSTWFTVNTTAFTKSFNLYGLSSKHILQFQVQAYTSAGPGPFSELAEAFISDIHPAPVLISVSSKQIRFNDVDRKEELCNFTDENIKMASYIAHEGKVYYLLYDMVLLRDIKSQSTVLLLEDKRLSGSRSMTVDWITRLIYVAVLSEQNGTHLFFIDLAQKKKILKTISTSQVSPKLSIDTILVYPLLRQLSCFREHQNGAQEGLSFGNNFRNWHDWYTPELGKMTEGSLLTNPPSFDVSLSTSEDSLKQITQRASDLRKVLDEAPVIPYQNQKGTKLSHCVWCPPVQDCSHLICCGSYTFLEQPSLQQVTLEVSSSDQNPPISGTLAPNAKDVSQRSTINSWRAMANCGMISSFRSIQVKNRLLNVENGSPYRLASVAFVKCLFSFADKRCLILASNSSKPVLLSTTNTSFTLQLPPVKSELTCPFIMSSTPTYIVTYRTLTNGDRAVPTYSTEVPSTTLEFQDNIALIPGLQPFSNYDLEVNMRNYYSFLLDVHPLGSFITAKTDYGVPEAAAIVEVKVLADSVVSIKWTEPTKPNGPLVSIRYQIQANNLPPNPISPWRKSEFPDEQLLLSLNNLQGGTEYEFKVLAFHPDEDWYTPSTVVYNRTFNAPAPPHNIVPGNTSLVLEWRAAEESIIQFWFELKQLSKSNWYEPINTSCTNRSVYSCMLTGVVPNTNYHVQVVVVFMSGVHSRSEPANFRTSVGVPSKPGTPQNVPGDENTIQWKTAEDNGSNLLYNILQYRKVVDDGRQLPSWQMAYNSSCGDICVWKSKAMEGTYQFRAAAANIIGLGDYSNISTNILLQKENSSSNTIGIIVGSILSIFLVLLLMAIFVMYMRLKHKDNHNKENVDVIHEDKELTKLRGLSNTVGLANACYAVGTLPTKTEMENLPSFPRENLSLCVFLGSGAFGEVYEGIAKEILGPGTGTRNVAVKTLKSDATDQEKVEFLKEAHLMSQFDHPNILKLLGVCLFNEPQYIILELMDGGDLLSYLRGARGNTLIQDAMLSPLDLLDMSLDISRGCVYLEKMHFVHRDLAARNCLVSVKEYNNPERTVKIGDFGLARDVYKSDYYRKRGEGFLPVRWMAPESLIDGIFTTRSDVWSFGVLLWELFTLGQQPYQGYSNIEVLHYVRSGQKMDSPENCPDDMWDLILKCWITDPLRRPSSAQILKHLEELKGCSLRCTRLQYKSVALEGVDNPGFEDTDASASDMQETGSLTLTEARNIDGLNYLMVTT